MSAIMLLLRKILLFRVRVYYSDCRKSWRKLCRTGILGQKAGMLNMLDSIKLYIGRLQVQIEQDLSSNYISGIHLIKKSVEQFIRSVVA